GCVGVGAPAEAGIAFVIGQIQVAGIVALNVVAAVAVRVVPADEIDGIGKVGATGPAIAGDALVLIPGAVQRLGIAEGIGRPRTGYYPQDAGARRTGTGAERGLLIDEGHGDGHGHAPALLGALGRLVPGAAVLEHVADVGDVARLRGDAAGEQCRGQ